MLAASAFVSGCETVDAGSFCAVAEPFYLSERTLAVMTDEEVTRTLEHNEHGAMLCGWKPARAG